MLPTTGFETGEPGAVLPAADRGPVRPTEEALSRLEAERYARHLLLPGVGRQGQEKLRAASVLVIGAGGLGSPVLTYLAAAGIGTLGIVDPDVVDLSNLQRQVVHGTADVGRPKTDSAAERVAQINPHVRVVSHPVAFSAANARDLVAAYDVVVDASDNFPTRYLANDACVLVGRPLVWGAVSRYDGQVSVWWAGHGPCYRCVFPVPPAPDDVPSCAEGGVLGVLPGTIGAMQATEVLKLVLGMGEPLVGVLVAYDALSARTDRIPLAPSPRCPVCAPGAPPVVLSDEPWACLNRPAESARTGSEPDGEMPAPPVVREVAPRRLAADLGGVDPPVLLDVREAGEREVAVIEGALWVPLGDLRERPGLPGVSVDRPVVVHCRSGARSREGAALLLGAGYRDVASLAGGILAWARDVDPSLPSY